MKALEVPVQLKQLITSNQAFGYRIIPHKKKEDGTVIFLSDSKQGQKLSQQLSIILPFPVEIKLESSEKLNSLLSFNYRSTTRVSNDLSKDKFLEQLLRTAKDFSSSDIHLEPYEDQCRVRFRIDGKLKEQYHLSKQEYQQLINKIKIEAGLDISQKRLPQDGRISRSNADEGLDIRVSTIPTLYGEKLVLRLLKRDAEHVALEELGFEKEALEMYLEGIREPQGIILISGPTGSGKTTTLYGTLKLLNKEQNNILTIEDPIEYKLKGINQVQLKEDIGLDFPKTLRTFLRQDPDIIMVGEIRDEKTAEMAIKAALTGHLVLSTIHTNSAWATISRLINMGIPSYLLASTLTMSVAQRLVRKLCSTCKREEKAEKLLFPDSFEKVSEITTHFVPVGCNECHFTGYQGRKALYEIISITRELQAAINRNELQIDQYIADQGLATLKSNAIELIKKGVTSIDEVYTLLKN